MSMLGNIKLARVIKFDAQSVIAAKDIEGQVNCKLHAHVQDLITQDNYDFIQTKEYERIVGALDSQMYLSVEKDMKPLYVDKSFISKLMNHAKSNPPKYLRGYQFLSNLMASSYFHLFEPSDLLWVIQNQEGYKKESLSLF